MAFTIDASALHRPLGFELRDLHHIVVERHSPERPGAAAAAILPPDAIADAERRELRAQLERSGGVLNDASMPAGPLVVASARGVVEGHGVSVLGLAAGRPLPRDRSALRVLLLTDARLAPSTLELWLHALMSRSFASLAGIATPLPADAILALSNGVAGAAELAPDSLGLRTLLVGGAAVAQRLVRQLLDESFAPERARVVQITVSGAADEAQGARVVEALAADADARTLMATTGPDRACCAAVAARVGAKVGSVHSSWAARGPQAVQGALRVDLDSGAAVATRWTAVRGAAPT